MDELAPRYPDYAASETEIHDAMTARNLARMRRPSRTACGACAFAAAAMLTALIADIIWRVV